MTIERILEVIKNKHPQADTVMLELAYEFAHKAHDGQKRMSGEDYIQHPLETAHKLAQMDIDMPTIIAGLLHDVPEETDVTLEEIKENFGGEIYELVKGITKLGTLKYRGLERYAENLRKMFVAMAEDVRVIFIKFADRIHNLKTLYALQPVKQKRVAQESLEIYAPIANRLGMTELQNELEDMAFPYVAPDQYKWVIEVSKKKYETRKREADKAIKMVAQVLKNHFVPLKIYGRAKRYYSLYQKLLRKDMDIDRVYDLVALRIIVNTSDECYRVLGIIHSIAKPLPGRVKDYIAQPKPNGYQSLHTTVYLDNKIVEFQIRTQEMDDEASWGIAAHWAFKHQAGGRRTKIPLGAEKMKWIKTLLEKSSDSYEPKEYLDKIRMDFFKNRIFVFTPKGDVIDLPEGAIPIDFAYHIHTYIGDHTVGAKVNGKMTTIATPLKSGDMCEILVDKKRERPSGEWINTTQTHLAKDKIRQSLKKNSGMGIFKIFNR